MAPNAPEQVHVVRTFVFADLAGYTALTEAHGDSDAASIALRFAALARALVSDEVELVKTIGDAVMLTAANPTVGVEAALALRSAIERETKFPAVRIGLQHGPALECERDYYGAAVNVASRVAGVATAGHILATAEVAALAKSPHARFEPVGTARLKNVGEPVRVFEVVDLAAGARSTGCAVQIDPVCRMVVDPTAAADACEVDGVRYLFCSLECAAAFTRAREPRPDA